MQQAEHLGGKDRINLLEDVIGDSSTTLLDYGTRNTITVSRPEFHFWRRVRLRETSEECPTNLWTTHIVRSVEV